MAESGRAVRALIVDDHDLVRAGLRSVLESLGTVDVCGEATTAAGALAAARRLAPDLVLLDLMLADGDGTALIGPLTSGETPARVLVMSMHDEDVWGRLVIAAGAGGFVAKAAEPHVLVEAIRTVAAGDRWINGRAVPRAACPEGAAAALTQRELEVLEGVAAGRCAKEIAAGLAVSPATVDSHKRNIRAKLGIQSGAELIVWAQSMRRRTRDH